MLQSLHIVNFAIIEDTIIELTDGDRKSVV